VRGQVKNVPTQNTIPTILTHALPMRTIVSATLDETAGEKSRHDRKPQLPGHRRDVPVQPGTDSSNTFSRSEIVDQTALLFNRDTHGRRDYVFICAGN
jgi:hypothetical protein